MRGLRRGAAPPEITRQSALLLLWFKDERLLLCFSCKQQQDLLSFLAVVLGLDNPAVSRLRLTWEVGRRVFSSRGVGAAQT